MITVWPICCISPLGNTFAENWIAARTGKDGISLCNKSGFNDEVWPQGRITALDGSGHRFSRLFEQALLEIEQSVGKSFFREPKNKLIVSTTKAEIEVLPKNGFSAVFDFCRTILDTTPIVLSNACISGVLAVSEAEKMIRAGIAENVIVLGIDVLSDFVTFGFQSLFALSDEKCRPFSASRKGINLGEAAAAMLVSRDHVSRISVRAGTSANDANHISGPSRTGEGLFRSVNKTLQIAGLQYSDISYISAHGTATLYNDDMESQAFTRLGMSEIPVHSMKSYFGHTLGAAGIIESVFAIGMLENDELYASLNCDDPGTAQPLNVQQRYEKKPIRRILKTASGFGGGNASILFEKP